MAVCRKPATWLSRCLLAVALLFGIVLMHALGHPEEHAVPKLSGGHITTSSHASATPAHQPVVAEPHHTTDPSPAHGAGATTAVCLAVLGAGVGALLVARAALGRPVRTAGPPVTQWFAYALRAIPPPEPPGSLLSRLSLLRI
ncbi:DUF6153 family protein [Streptomyces sp. NPDC052042]|uniref:DUF6153 family protein n=1 Tax=Streptomyces sp. NPDC052042 TaxID=3365683 RepID=UPI0037D4AC99